MTTCAPAGVDTLNGTAVRNAAAAAATSTSFFIMVPSLDVVDTASTSREQRRFRLHDNVQER
jgi:hypothetical protein